MTNPEDNETQLRIDARSKADHDMRREPTRDEEKPAGPSGRAGGPVKNVDRDEPPR